MTLAIQRCRNGKIRLLVRARQGIRARSLQLKPQCGSQVDHDQAERHVLSSVAVGTECKFTEALIAQLGRRGAPDVRVGGHDQDGSRFATREHEEIAEIQARIFSRWENRKNGACVNMPLRIAIETNCISNHLWLLDFPVQLI
jgi:hypothetical protein